MANKTRSELKNYFETGKKPTQGEYADLIDNSVHKDEDKASLSDIDNGTSTTKFVTPKGAKRAVEKHVPNANISTAGVVKRASVNDAEQGINIDAYVTPLGTKRAIEAFAPALSPVQSVNDMTGNITIDLGTDSGWQTANLLTGILNYGGTYQQARYRKKNGVVYIEGLVKGGTETGNVTVFKLPLNFRPNKRIILNSIRGGNKIHRTDISAAGEVICYSYSTNYTSISGISFLVD